MQQKMDNERSVAVIGGGVSGLLVAWLLRNEADVHLFEASGELGGHTHTAYVEENGQEIPIDTGFMVFNHPNYPLLTRFFKEIGIQSYATDMSFAVSLNKGGFEYAGSGLSSLFAQKSNLGNPAFFGMLFDILRFNRLAEQAKYETGEHDCSLESWLDTHGLGKAFRNLYLYPMAAAIWSCPSDAIGEFPVHSFLRFFRNHGLSTVSEKPQWHTVKQGASSYVERIAKDLEHVHLNTRVLGLNRVDDGVVITLSDGTKQRFDEAVFACHSNQALDILQDGSDDERLLLSSVPYQSNTVYLHTDQALMPKRKKVWSSWNYLGDLNLESGRMPAVSVTYWMNSLQDLDTSTDYFVSLNPIAPPRKETIVEEYEYHHPVFNENSFDLSRHLDRLQGKNRLWYCGAWIGYGFHEDGIRSAMDMAVRFGLVCPWPEEYEASRRLIHDREEIMESAA